MDTVGDKLKLNRTELDLLVSCKQHKSDPGQQARGNVQSLIQTCTTYTRYKLPVGSQHNLIILERNTGLFLNLISRIWKEDLI